LSGRTTELIETVKALAQVQAAGRTIVDHELRRAVHELMDELNLK